MKNFRAITDQAAMGLSLLCMLHCLALPLILIILPSVAALPLSDESFHLWMVFAVIPISAYALTVGCRQHKRYQLFSIGLIGLACLVAAITLAESIFGEAGEKILTTIGAMIISYGHYKNYRLCQDADNCCCAEHST